MARGRALPLDEPTGPARIPEPAPAHTDHQQELQGKDEKPYKKPRKTSKRKDNKQQDEAQRATGAEQGLPGAADGTGEWRATPGAQQGDDHAEQTQLDKGKFPGWLPAAGPCELQNQCQEKKSEKEMQFTWRAKNPTWVYYQTKQVVGADSGDEPRLSARSPIKPHQREMIAGSCGAGECLAGGADGSEREDVTRTEEKTHEPLSALQRGSRSSVAPAPLSPSQPLQLRQRSSRLTSKRWEGKAGDSFCCSLPWSERMYWLLRDRRTVYTQTTPQRGDGAGAGAVVTANAQPEERQHVAVTRILTDTVVQLSNARRTVFKWIFDEQDYNCRTEDVQCDLENEEQLKTERNTFKRAQLVLPCICSSLKQPPTVPQSQKAPQSQPLPYSQPPPKNTLTPPHSSYVLPSKLLSQSPLTGAWNQMPLPLVQQAPSPSEWRTSPVLPILVSSPASTTTPSSTMSKLPTSMQDPQSRRAPPSTWSLFTTPLPQGKISQPPTTSTPLPTSTSTPPPPSFVINAPLAWAVQSSSDPQKLPENKETKWAEGEIPPTRNPRNKPDNIFKKIGKAVIHSRNVMITQSNLPPPRDVDPKQRAKPCLDCNTCKCRKTKQGYLRCTRCNALVNQLVSTGRKQPPVDKKGTLPSPITPDSMGPCKWKDEHGSVKCKCCSENIGEEDDFINDHCKRLSKAHKLKRGCEAPVKGREETTGNDQLQAYIVQYVSASISCNLRRGTSSTGDSSATSFAYSNTDSQSSISTQDSIVGENKELVRFAYYSTTSSDSAKSIPGSDPPCRMRKKAKQVIDDNVFDESFFGSVDDMAARQKGVNSSVMGKDKEKPKIDDIKDVQRVEEQDCECLVIDAENLLCTTCNKDISSKVFRRGRDTASGAATSGTAASAAATSGPSSKPQPPCECFPTCELVTEDGVKVRSEYKDAMNAVAVREKIDKEINLCANKKFTRKKKNSLKKYFLHVVDLIKSDEVELKPEPKPDCRCDIKSQVTCLENLNIQIPCTCRYSASKGYNCIEYTRKIRKKHDFSMIDPNRMKVPEVDPSVSDDIKVIPLCGWLSLGLIGHKCRPCMKDHITETICRRAPKEESKQFQSFPLLSPSPTIQVNKVTNTLAPMWSLTAPQDIDQLYGNAVPEPEIKRMTGKLTPRIASMPKSVAQTTNSVFKPKKESSPCNTKKQFFCHQNQLTSLKSFETLEHNTTHLNDCKSLVQPTSDTKYQAPDTNQSNTMDKTLGRSPANMSTLGISKNPYVLASSNVGNEYLNPTEIDLPLPGRCVIKEAKQSTRNQTVTEKYHQQESPSKQVKLELRERAEKIKQQNVENYSSDEKIHSGLYRYPFKESILPTPDFDKMKSIIIDTKEKLPQPRDYSELVKIPSSSTLIEINENKNNQNDVQNTPGIQINKSDTSSIARLVANASSFQFNVSNKSKTGLQNTDITSNLTHDLIEPGNNKITVQLSPLFARTTKSSTQTINTAANSIKLPIEPPPGPRAEPLQLKPPELPECSTMHLTNIKSILQPPCDWRPDTGALNQGMNPDGTPCAALANILAKSDGNAPTSSAAKPAVDKYKDELHVTQVGEEYHDIIETLESRLPAPCNCVIKEATGKEKKKKQKSLKDHAAEKRFQQQKPPCKRMKKGLKQRIELLKKEEKAQKRPKVSADERPPTCKCPYKDILVPSSNYDTTKENLVGIRPTLPRPCDCSGEEIENADTSDESQYQYRASETPIMYRQSRKTYLNYHSQFRLFKSNKSNIKNKQIEENFKLKGTEKKQGEDESYITQKRINSDMPLLHSRCSWRSETADIKEYGTRNLESARSSNRNNEPSSSKLQRAISRKFGKIFFTKRKEHENMDTASSEAKCRTDSKGLDRNSSLAPNTEADTVGRHGLRARGLHALHVHSARPA